jgi:hypothetical protein
VNSTIESTVQFADVKNLPESSRNILVKSKDKKKEASVNKKSILKPKKPLKVVKKLTNKQQALEDKRKHALANIVPDDLAKLHFPKKQQNILSSVAIVQKENAMNRLVSELEDFKSYLVMYLNIDDKGKDDKIKEFTHATKNNPCCK